MQVLFSPTALRGWREVDMIDQGGKENKEFNDLAGVFRPTAERSMIQMGL